MTTRWGFVLLLAAVGAAAAAQDTKLEELRQFHRKVDGMPAFTRLAGYTWRQAMVAKSPYGAITFRNVGPEVQGGRIVDLASVEGKPGTLFVAFATGGLCASRSC
jgi:hypothetical protein